MTPEERAELLGSALFVAIDASPRERLQIIAHAIKKAVEEEREACAKIAAAHEASGETFTQEDACEWIAAAIRAHGEKR